MDSWPVKEAEARFGEMLERCLAEGPQVVTRDGTEAAVLVPMREWARRAGSLDAERPKIATLKDWLTTDFARGDIPLPERGTLQFRPVDFDE